MEENTELQCQLSDARQEMEDLSSKFGAIVSDIKLLEDDLSKVKEERNNALEICSFLFQRQDISTEQENELKAMLEAHLPHIYLYIILVKPF